MPEGASPRVIDELARHSVDVIPLAYDRVQLNGGGIHCSTCPLIRDPVYRPKSLRFNGPSVGPGDLILAREPVTLRGFPGPAVPEDGVRDPTGSRPLLS